MSEANGGSGERIRGHSSAWMRASTKQAAGNEPGQGESKHEADVAVEDQQSPRPWEIPVLLEPPSPPRLPPGVFVGTFGNYAAAVAEHTETPIEVAALIGMACAAAALQGRVSLLVEPNYFEPLNIWVLPAMESGSRKTAVVNKMKAPLVAWDRAKRKESEPIIKKAESHLATKLANIKKLRDAAAKKRDLAFDADSERIAQMEADLPPVPTSPRLLMDDATPEHTATIMAQNTERIAVIDSECGSLFGQLQGRYSSNGIRNLDVYLKSYDGSDVHVERGSRPAIHLWHPLMSFGITPQPAALIALTSDEEFRGRGLLARFLYARCDAKLGYRPLRSAPIDPTLEERYLELMRELADLPPLLNDDKELRPHVLRLSGDAAFKWKRFQRFVENEMREGGRLERLRDWGSKLPGNVARIAGVLHCLDLGADAIFSPDVSTPAMQRAIDLSEFFIAHAVSTFDFLGTDQVLDIARELWRKVCRERWSSFKARDAWQGFRGRKGFSKMEGFHPVLNLLLEHYLIRRAQPPKGQKGRSPDTFEVHPQFTSDWQ